MDQHAWRNVMKNLTISSFIFLLLFAVNLNAGEIVRIKSFDGEVIEGRLVLPQKDFKHRIVIDVPSSGPHTYEDTRQVGRSTVFKYHDYFADEFARRGVAYFSYSTRYTVPDSTPPDFYKVDKQKFISYSPMTEVQDLEQILTFLRKDKRLSSSRFLLLGKSSGAIVTSLVADRQKVSVDALFMSGTPSEDLFTTMIWQNSGESVMITFRKFFDTNKDNIIQESEYASGDPRAIARVGGQKFAELDVNRDSVITTEDFRLIMEPRLKQIIAAVDNKDDEWIWNSYFKVGTRWIAEHRAIEPNKERILRLNIPIFIFHGVNDDHCPVEGILHLQKRAQELKKDNIRVFVFPDHDHSLEFLSWIFQKSIPEGLKALFDQVDQF
jgi:pimeloyl-ACP methyl ester carboxylesterase